MSILPITVYGDKILREKTEKVNAVDDDLIKNIRDMFETMRHANGIGLAANQVGLDKSVFVIDLSPVEGFEKSKPVVFINPEIIRKSDELVVLEEGCLSLPDLRADVERPEKITIKYLDTDENEIMMDADDLFARVILHEYDHLIGRMIPDRVERSLKPDLRKILDDIINRRTDADYLLTKKPLKIFR